MSTHFCHVCNLNRDLLYVNHITIYKLELVGGQVDSYNQAVDMIGVPPISPYHL